MSDREFENYLALLGGMLRLRRTQREGVAGELRDHLIEHVAHLETSGITHEEAVRRALEEFGDAAALAAGFSALVGMRRRRLIMRCTIGTTIVMTGLVVAMLAFRPPVIDDHSIAKAQAESTSADKARGDGDAKAAARRFNPSNPDEVAREILKGQSDVEFSEVPLSDALAYLSDKHGIQHYIDKRSLSDAGKAIDAPVTLRLKSVPLDMVLDLILREHQLGYRIRNGVIMIASEQDVQSQVDVRVYRVPEETTNELLMLIPETIEPHSWRSDPQIRSGPYGGMGMGGGTPGMMGGMPGAGGPGSIRPFRGVLVISQSPEVHQKIEKLIDELASAGALNPQPQRAPVGLGGEGGAAGSGSTGPAPGYGQTSGRGGYGGVRGGYGAGRGPDGQPAGDATDPARRRSSEPTPADPALGPPGRTPTAAGSPSSTPVGPPAAVPGPTPPRGAGPRSIDPTSGESAAPAVPPTGTPPGIRTPSAVPPPSPSAAEGPAARP